MTVSLARNWQLVRHTETALRSGSESLGNVPALLRALLEEEAWREFSLPSGEQVTYCGFGEFVVADPPRGLGATVDLVRRVVAESAETLDLLDQAMQGQHGGDRSKSNNVPLAPAGNSSVKALRRLRKSAPELHAEVLAGRLSAHKAMIAAGFRPRTVSVRTDRADSLAASLRRNLKPDVLAELRRLLGEEDDP
jgi:hypothetical protein